MGTGRIGGGIARSVGRALPVALLGTALLLGIVGCSNTAEPSGDTDSGAGAASSGVPVIVDESAGQPLSAEPTPVTNEPAPLEPDPTPASDPLPQYEGLAVSYTGNSTVFTTAYYTVEVPDGLLPEGWTYEYSDATITSLGTPDWPHERGHSLYLTWPDQGSFSGTGGLRVEAYKNQDDWPGYQGYFVSEKAGASGAGGGWRVVVAGAYSTEDEAQGVHDAVVRFLPHVDPSSVLYGAGWAGPDPYAAAEPEATVGPDPVQIGPIDPGVQYEGLSVIRTDSATVFTTAYYTVTVPDGFLPNGWTYEYRDTTITSLGTPDWPHERGHGLYFTWPDSSADSYSGVDGFWVEVYKNQDDWPGYQGYFVSEKLGDSGAGGGWRVVIADSYQTNEKAPAAHDYIVWFSQYVDPTTVLNGAGWADAVVPADPEPEPEPETPEAVELPPVEPPVVTKTETGTLLVTPHFSVEIPDGFLPEGWTYFCQNAGDCVSMITSNVEEPGYCLILTDSSGIALFMVDSYKNLLGDRLYYGTGEYQLLGYSAAGDGWQVAVRRNDWVPNIMLEDLDAFFQQAVSCVDVTRTL